MRFVREFAKNLAFVLLILAFWTSSMAVNCLEHWYQPTHEHHSIWQMAYQAATTDAGQMPVHHHHGATAPNQDQEGGEKNVSCHLTAGDSAANVNVLAPALADADLWDEATPRLAPDFTTALNHELTLLFQVHTTSPPTGPPRSA